jgi:predicted 2-oxoglutarate/Fe(II)-dependent dioxygenase YbiX
MPRADILCRLGGLFAVEQLLSVAECETIAGTMRTAASESATVRDPHTGEFVVDPTARRVKWVELPAENVTLIASRLEDVRPEVARHYGLTLTGQQSPQFLAYGQGDFYRPHRDNTEERDASGSSSERRVSAVLFLNPVSPEPDDRAYGGGSLTFYGLLDDARAESVGLPLDAEPGLLITFRSSTVHGVSPVTHGRRFTAVSWYV